MNIYTQLEQQVAKYSPMMAVTAASFILETKTGRKQKLHAGCLAFEPDAVTLQRVNELTQQIIASTPIVYN
jgi:hypothetical protein